MASDPPGWYRDPKRPGMRRYWDGHAWVDVDQVVEKKAGDNPVDEHSPAPPAQGNTPHLRLVTQRHPERPGANGPDGTPSDHGTENQQD